MSDTKAAQDDDVYLRQFGIEPKLKRAIGFVSSSLFAIAFQGPTTGALLITGATLAFGGPAFIWAIPLIFVFQFLIALTWAELSSHYPLEGGIYQWARYLGGDALAWFTGLFYLVAILLVMPAVGLVISIVLSGLFPSIPFTPQNEIIISLLTIVATALIMSTSVRVVALINNVGVTLELILLGGAAIFLLGHVHQPLSVLFTTGGAEGKDSYIVPFLIVVALVITQFVGFETAGTFAEETKNSRVSPARAIMTALAGACLFVFVFDFALILSLPDVAKGMAAPGTVIPDTLTANFGSFGANVFLVGAFIAVSSTSIATLAAIVRTMYGMARENQLPASKYLARLSGRSQEPITCIVVAALLSMAPLLFVQQIPVIVAAITFMILIPYFIVLASLIRKRLGGWPATSAPFKLGAWGMPLAIIGIVWVGFVAIDAAWPRDATNPNLGPFPILEEIAVVTFVLGGLWWLLALRGKVTKRIEPGAPVAKPVMP
jgi:amino acid transporter